MTKAINKYIGKLEWMGAFEFTDYYKEGNEEIMRIVDFVKEFHGFDLEALDEVTIINEGYERLTYALYELDKQY